MKNGDKGFYYWYKQYRQSTDIESWDEAIGKMMDTIFMEKLRKNVQRNILLVFNCLDSFYNEYLDVDELDCYRKEGYSVVKWKRKKEVIEYELKKGKDKIIITINVDKITKFGEFSTKDLPSNQFFLDTIYQLYLKSKTGSDSESLDINVLMESILAKYMEKYKKYRRQDYGCKKQNLITETQETDLIEYRTKDDLLFVLSLGTLINPIYTKAYNQIMKTGGNKNGYYKTTGTLNKGIFKRKIKNHEIVRKRRI